MKRILIDEKRRMKDRRRRTRLTQGDMVLIREMDPNRPEIAHKASEQVSVGDFSDSMSTSSKEDFLGRKVNENVKHLSDTGKKVNNSVADTGTIQTETEEVHHESPKEPVAPLKGILRRPTKKFPEDPAPIREGVAPASMGKDIPVGSRWTRIDRRLVNPEALEEAKERFEERMDCVIVLRVLTRHEIQKLANRTKEIREARDDASIATDPKNSDGVGVDTNFTTSESSKPFTQPRLAMTRGRQATHDFRSPYDPYVREAPTNSYYSRAAMRGLTGSEMGGLVRFLSQSRSPPPVDFQFGHLDQNDQDTHESPEVPGELPRDSGLSQIDSTYDKLHKERVNSDNVEGNASTPGTQEVNVQRSSERFQTVSEECFDHDEEHRMAADEAERAAEELETATRQASSSSVALRAKEEAEASPRRGIGSLGKKMAKLRRMEEAQEKKESDEKRRDEKERLEREAIEAAEAAEPQNLNKIFGQAMGMVLEDQNFMQILKAPFDPEDFTPEDDLPWSSENTRMDFDETQFENSGEDNEGVEEDSSSSDDNTMDDTAPNTCGSIANWLKNTLADEISDERFEWDYSASASGSSSYAASVASVFSVASLASSASDISKGSGYSAVQIATATKVLLSIFYEDEALQSLYTRAIEAQNIGPERLQRNLRRLFRAYATLLESEATERLEHLASRLVRAKSAALAKSIVEKLQNDRISAELSPSEGNNESSEEEDDGASSRPVNEDAFEDLVTFRQFLVESEAFKTFHNQLQAFVVPNRPHAGRTETVAEEALDSDGDIGKSDVSRPPAQFKTIPTWHERFKDVGEVLSMLHVEAFTRLVVTIALHLNMDTLLLARDRLLVPMGLLEPALEQNKTRLRWRCRCGDPMYSDMIELREGGIAKLMNNMQRSSGIKVQATAYSQQSRNQQYIVPRPDRWLWNAVTKIATAFGASSKSSSTCLPQHNAPCATTSSSIPSPTAAQKAVLYLSMCMHRTRRRKIIHQPRVDHLTTDRTLLTFLQDQYTSHRGRFLTFARLKSVEKITFIKFRLPTGGSVDVLRCISDSPDRCVCIPPPRTAGGEYDYAPSPPETHPPIAPEYLASLLTCMGDVGENDYWIRDQLPKRTCGKLQGRDGKPAVGWGIYFVEGWDREIISLLVLFMFVLASLLFGVLWWKFQFDLQGGFGVSAYMMAVCTILISVVVTRLENKG